MLLERGMATEALVAFAFHNANVHVVRAHTLPEAPASQRVLTKCGFRYIGEVVDPEDGLQTTPTPWQLSVAVAAKRTTASHLAGAVLALMLAGHVITGGSLSMTVTLNPQLPTFAEVSVTLQLTRVTPTWKLEPEGGLQGGVASGFT